MKIEGLCGYLHTATLCTNDMAEIKKFYVDGMKMTLDGPIPLSEEQQMDQAHLWGISSTIEYDYYHLHRPSVPSLVQLRVLHLKDPQPAIHKSYDCLELGPFSLGFPNMDQVDLDQRLEKLGIESMAPMQEDTIPRPDGTEYRYWETIYKGPDFLHCVGIERGDGMPQLAPCNPSAKMCGPGYSAQVIDHSDNFMSFMTDVLDMELKGDRYWDAGEGSALGVPQGTPFRFMLVYAKGSSQNHYLFLDFQKSEMIDPGVAPRIPHRGLAAWTIPTRALEEVYRRATAFGVEIIKEPSHYDSPIFGNCKIFSLLAPNGFLLEIFETIK